MSTFARSVPWPNCKITSTTWSIVMYEMLHMSLSMPSFTQAFMGDDKSTIRRHLPGLAFFGITPKGLMWQ